MAPHMNIVIPAYNSGWLLIRALDSVLAQDYTMPYTVTLIDDASTDNEVTAGIMRVFQRANEYHPTREVEIITNRQRWMMPRNLTHLRERGSVDDVCVILDADDQLAAPDGLYLLAAHFEDPNLWFSYGSYAHSDGSGGNPALPYPPEVIFDRRFRMHDHDLFNHPICFRRFLIDEIEDWELQDDRGRWFDRCYDFTIAMPMLELSVGHFKWLPEITYIYNDNNPESEIRLPNATEAALHVTSTVRRREARLPRCPDVPLTNPHRH